jgi:uncharacterized protein YoaH (UPF0181 family)
MWRGVGVLGIALLAIVSLFAIEAAPLRGASYEASAWSTGSFDSEEAFDTAFDNFNAGTASWGPTGGGEHDDDYNNHIGSTCTLNADMSVTNAGVDVTLNWDTTPEATYVTINKFPDEEFEASGSKDTFITETTKFIAYTHYADSNDTASCYVTVNFKKPPVVEDPCKDASLTIDDTDFTWDGPPALSHYTATFCDDTTTGKIDMCVEDDTTVSLEKRIAKVEAKGGQCYITETQECPPPEEEDSCEDITLTIDDNDFTWDGPPKLETYSVTYCDDDTTGWVDVCVEDHVVMSLDKRIKKVIGKSEECTVEKTQNCPPPTPDPEWPECPFEDDADTTVVYFDGKGLRSDRSTADATSSSYPVSLPRGTYTIKSASWDGYPTRVHAYQPEESWYLNLMSDGDIIESTWTTTDLDDYVAESLKIDTIADEWFIDSPIDSIVAHHSAYPDTSSPNSVQPICVAISVEPPIADEDPICTMSANPTTIYKGDSSTITWTSFNANDVDFEGLTSTALNGSLSVNPTVTTTYKGTFTDADHESVVCTATVTVRDLPEDDEPVCTMSISPSSVSRNDDATLSWTSENADSASINQGIGDVSLDGSRTVKVTDDITYTGTFEDEDGDTVTCSASVNIKSSGGGGGGRCLNCDDDEDDDDDDRKDRDRKPSVSLKKNELVAGAAISLSQVPYTGFSASPLVTAFFWLALLALSVVIAYFITMARNRSMAFAGVIQAKTNDDIDLMEVATERPVYTVPAPVAPYMASQGAGSDANAIEDLAHKENILLSPEATREILIAAEAKGSLENTAVFLTQIFKEAQARYPREDGWILLSKERCASLLGAPVTTEAPRQSVRAHEFKSQTQNGVAYGMPTSKPTPAHTIAVAPAPTSASHQVASFVQLVSANEQQKAFELIRTITSQGVDLGVFIARVVRDLDEVYKNRIEGNRTPDQTLVELTSGWTTEMFEAVLGSLVECIDYSYSSTRIGTKIALAKVFEHFTK